MTHSRVTQQREGWVLLQLEIEASYPSSLSPTSAKNEKWKKKREKKKPQMPPGM